jgi:MoxR-like ATPase
MQTTANTIAEQAQQILSQVRKVIVGKDQTLLWVLAAMLSGGHILLEDIPGVG